MKITDIKVFPVREEKLKAFVSIVLDDCFMVNDIKVIRGKEGFFISMPSRRKRNGKFKDIAHPLNNETRQSMEKEILAAYEAAFEGAPEGRAEVKVRPTAGVESQRARPAQKVSQPPAVATPPGPGTPPELSEPGAPAEQPRAVQSDAPARSEPATPDAAGKGVEGPADHRPVKRSPANGPNDGEDADKSPEEVAEHHLRDSFWST